MGNTSISAFGMSENEKFLLEWEWKCHEENEKYAIEF